MRTADTTAPDATRRVDQLLLHYASSHQHPTNERIHLVAIPCIVFSLLGLLYTASPVLALLFLLASLVYYWSLSKVFFVVMLVWSGILLAIVVALHAQGLLLPLSASVFVVAWIFQFIGHHLEGKKPSFLEDVQYLWVGPLFVLRHWFVRLGWRW